MLNLLSHDHFDILLQNIKSSIGQTVHTDENSNIHTNNWMCDTGIDMCWDH
jgi:hypothetical protein